MIDFIQKIQPKLEERSNGLVELRYNHRGKFYEIELFVEAPATPLCGIFFELINDSEFAEEIEALRFEGVDEGINGINHWDLTALTQKKKVIFKNLRQISFPLNDKNHNRIILTGDEGYQENGMLAKLLAKMPCLEFLQSPSAPNEAFFKIPNTIKTLHIQSGYDHQRFLYNLAQSKTFEQLETLKFWDYAETYVENYRQYATSVEDYEALFASTHLPKLKKLHLYHTQLSPQDQEKLRSLPLALQLDELVIETAL